MKIEVDLNKRFIIVTIAISLFLIGIVGVIAYSTSGTGGVPATFGHSVDEIDWSKPISGNVTASYFIGDGSKLTGISGTGGGGGSQWQNQTGTNNIYYNTGNVGIGTANPTGKLDVVSRYYKYVASGHAVAQGTPRCPCDTSSSTSECDEFETNNSVGSLCYDWYTSGGGWNVFYDAVKFQVVEEHYLFDAGRLGIGVNSIDPYYKLDVAGGIKITDGSVVLTNSNNYASGITSTVTGNPAGNSIYAVYGHATNTGAWVVSGVRGRTEGGGYGVIGESGANGYAGVSGVAGSSGAYGVYVSGGKQLGLYSGTGLGTVSVFATYSGEPKTATCTSGCGTSAQCLGAFRSDNQASVSCGDSTNVYKLCLCAKSGG
jgi:hypothetical protein